MTNKNFKSYHIGSYPGGIALRWFLAIVLVLSTVADTSAAIKKEASEYELKAVYLYNFLLFTEWPEVKIAEPEKKKKPIVIGIIGKDPFKDAFKDVEGKPINDKKLVIKRFKVDASVKSLKECDMLFIGSSLKKKAVKKILISLKNHPVLTVSEKEGFLESNGMINLVMKKDIIEIEINKIAAERVGIKFRSKLLRVAARVVEKTNGKKDKK